MCQQFDHTLILKMTAEMRDDIDRALILVQDTVIRTRSEFLRAACQYALDNLAAGCGDVAVTMEERKRRILRDSQQLPMKTVSPSQDTDDGKVTLQGFDD